MVIREKILEINDWIEDEFEKQVIDVEEEDWVVEDEAEEAIVNRWRFEKMCRDLKIWSVREKKNYEKDDVELKGSNTKITKAIQKQEVNKDTECPHKGFVTYL